MRRENIIRAIQEGTLAANEEYLEWTGGWSIGDSGVEGHLVSVIARRLHEYKDDNDSLAMELPFQFIRKWSGARRPRGKPPNVVSDGNRADIVLFNADGKPTCVIEIKRKWATGPCFADLRRVNELVTRYSHQQNGSLRRGFLAVYLEKPQSVVDELEEIKRRVLENFSDANFRFHESNPFAMEDDDGNKWESACLCIEISAPNRTTPQ